jgi:branched-chain amino acid transport system substrate-binding protein
MAGMIGQTIGGYQILEQIGQGGMATIYKAYQPSLDRYVALKILPRHMAQEAGFEQRFRREARAAAKLEHPHIVPIFDFGQENDLFYIALRYVPAGTLKERMGQPLPLDFIIGVVSQIAEALDYAHEQGVVHRDIKPSNILLDRGDWALLTDFGVARIVQSTEHITSTGVGVGTPAYMSPEQGLGKKVDSRSDIYSLGVVLYEMLTGQVPYQADTPMAVVLKHIHDPLPRPRDINRGVPEAVERVVLKSLAKAPDDRYHSAAELAMALRSAASEAAALRARPSDLEATSDIALEAPSEARPRTKPGRLFWLLPAFLAVAGLGWLLGQLSSADWLRQAFGLERPPTPVPTQAPLPTQRPVTPVPTRAPVTPVPAQAPQPAAPFVCTDAIGCVTVRPDEPIHIAYVLAISGPSEVLGIDSRNGAEIALADRGTVLGHEILFTGEDGACSAEGGQSAGARLAADPSIVGVIGTSCSSEAHAAMPLLSAAGFTMISPSNTAPDLTQPGNENQWPGFFRTAPSDQLQGVAAADFAYNFLGVRRAATIHDGSSYAEMLAEVFRGAFEDLGGTASGALAISPDQTDMRDVLADIAAGAPDLIYYPIFMPAGALITIQAHETAGLEDVVLMGADGLFSRDVVQGAGEDVEGLYVSSPGLPALGGAYQEHFVPMYEEMFGSTPISIFHAHAYDAMMLLLDAITEVAVVDPDGTLHIGRQALRDALYAVENYPGLTGNLTCTDTGDCGAGLIAVYQYHVGQFPPERIWP